MTRQTKTPKERAEEDLAAANRKVVRLERELDNLKLQAARKSLAFTEALALRDFLKNHPALRPPTPESTTPTQEEGQA